MLCRKFAFLLLITSLFAPNSFAQDEKKQEEENASPTRRIEKLIKDGKLKAAANELEEAIEADPGLLKLRQRLASAYARKRNYKGAGEQYAKFAEAKLESPNAPIADVVEALGAARIYMPRAGRAKDVLPMYEAANKKFSASVDMTKASDSLQSLLTLHDSLAMAMKSDGRSEEANELLREDLKKMAALNEKDDSVKAVECHAMAMRHVFSSLPVGDERQGLFEEHQEMLGTLLDDGKNSVFMSYMSAAMRQISMLARNQPVTAKGIVEDVESRMEALADDKQMKRMLPRYERSLASYKSRIESGLRMAELIGKKAPDFDVAAWVSEDGKPVDLKGKVVLLDFWAIWCGPCIRTFPHLKHLQEEYGDKGFQVVGVTRYYNYTWDDEKERAVRGKRGEEGDPEAEHETIRKFLASHGLTHPSMVTPKDTDMQRQYAVTGIPHAVVIDREGIVRMIKVGSGICECGSD